MCVLKKLVGPYLVCVSNAIKVEEGNRASCNIIKYGTYDVGYPNPTDILMRVGEHKHWAVHNLFSN